MFCLEIEGLGSRHSVIIQRIKSGVLMVVYDGADIGTIEGSKVTITSEFN